MEGEMPPSDRPDDLPGDLRESLRDLIPGYQGPPDPYLRVGASVRRRRTRGRLLVTVASAAGVAVVLVGASLALPPGGEAPAAGPGQPDTVAVPDRPTGSGGEGSRDGAFPPDPTAPRFVVARGD